jgi:CelD/BcsL family acetyltransferase involved in cellulose biosynthesis
MQGPALVMQVELAAGRNLDASLVCAWAELQLANPELASPYFAPEFTQVVASIRNNVDVAVVRENGDIAAFFVFERGEHSVGIPVAGIFSDYQGLICRPDFTCDARELLKSCGLVAWDFDHLLASQASFAPFHRFCVPSPQIDLSQGYEAYAATRRAAISVRSMMRRIERDVGPLRYVAHATDRAPLQQTLEWKSRQYVKGGHCDLFSLGWTRPLLEALQGLQTERCAGMLSLLYAGDRLVAGHFGMRSRTVWHYWFPAYDAEMAKYSPGMILLLNMAQHAPSIGLRTIDLGTGLCLYKKRLMNAAVTVASGSIERPSLVSLNRSARRAMRTVVLNSPIAGPARQLVRWFRGRRAQEH